MYSELVGRKLWYDGNVTVPAKTVVDVLSKSGSSRLLCVDELSPQIVEYNKLVSRAEQIKVKNTLDSIHSTWTLPDDIMDVNVEEYLIQRLIDTEDVEHCDFDARVRRMVDELERYIELDKINALRATIHIVHIFEQNNVVWGTGRGSGVSSYILYLIGIHDVDSFAYDLDISDFLG